MRAVMRGLGQRDQSRAGRLRAQTSASPRTGARCPPRLRLPPNNKPELKVFRHCGPTSPSGARDYILKGIAGAQRRSTTRLLSVGDPGRPAGEVNSCASWSPAPGLLQRKARNRRHTGPTGSFSYSRWYRRPAIRGRSCLASCASSKPSMVPGITMSVNNRLISGCARWTD